MTKEPDKYDVMTQKFAKMMADKMRENAHKGDSWRQDSIINLFGRVQEELEEVFSAWDKGEKADIWRECADVANFMMMLVDKTGGFEVEP